LFLKVLLYYCKEDKEMEFEYRGTIYVDIDELVRDFIEDDWDDVWDFVTHWVANLDEYDFYHIESWMIDIIITKMMNNKAIQIKLEEKGE
jgi:hypothetical protein